MKNDSHSSSSHHCVTVDHHQKFRESIAPAPEFDEDEINFDFDGEPAARRSDREISRLFEILDTLPTAHEGRPHL